MRRPSVLNIDTVQYGPNVLPKLRDWLSGRTLVVTQKEAWQSVERRLGPLHPDRSIAVTSVRERDLEALVEEAASFDAIVGVGGGMAVDTAKYLAWRTHRTLRLVPTIVSTDAFATEAAGVRLEGARVRYVGHAHSADILVDFGLLRDSPAELTRAGVGDILSCHTAARDWEIAVEDGRSEYPFDALAVRRARALVARLDDYADEVRMLSDLGLKVLIDCHLEVVEICQPLGHFRAEEGSEHFFFYAIEHLTERPYVHGQIVGLGLHLMSGLQGNAPQMIDDLQNRLGVSWRPQSFGLPLAVVEEALTRLSTFCREERLWYSVIDRGVSASFVAEALRHLAP
jgi:glycerol-1-phosphate dehydrogenase [NAD(P)+]